MLRVGNKGASINRCGNRTSALMAASGNRAERKAIAETLEAKVSGMSKMSSTTPPAKGKGKTNKGKGKTKDRMFGMRTHTQTL